MALTASEFRRRLFTHLEKAAAGKPVEIEYKGVTLRVSPVAPVGSKFERAKMHDILLVPSDAVPVESDPNSWDGQDEWDSEVEEIFGKKDGK